MRPSISLSYIFSLRPQDDRGGVKCDYDGHDKYFRENVMVGQQGGACKLVGDDKGHLSGSGENQRIMTFEKTDAGSSPQRALAFDD